MAALSCRPNNNPNNNLPCSPSPVASWSRGREIKTCCMMINIDETRRWRVPSCTLSTLISSRTRKFRVQYHTHLDLPSLARPIIIIIQTWRLQGSGFLTWPWDCSSVVRHLLRRVTIQLLRTRGRIPFLFLSAPRGSMWQLPTVNSP